MWHGQNSPFQCNFASAPAASHQSSHTSERCHTIRSAFSSPGPLAACYTVSMSVTRCHLRLRDGRWLSYVRWWPEQHAHVGNDAEPQSQAAAANVLYHHGWPSSAREAELLQAAAFAAGVQLLSFDRPGVGGSCYHAAMSFSSVAQDVAELMDAVGWRSAIQCGTSGEQMLVHALHMYMHAQLPAPAQQVYSTAASTCTQVGALTRLLVRRCCPVRVWQACCSLPP
jgi:hypothetical protein